MDTLTRLRNKAKGSILKGKQVLCDSPNAELRTDAIKLIAMAKEQLRRLNIVERHR